MDQIRPEYNIECSCLLQRLHIFPRHRLLGPQKQSHNLGRPAMARAILPLTLPALPHLTPQRQQIPISRLTPIHADNHKKRGPTQPRVHRPGMEAGNQLPEQRHQRAIPRPHGSPVQHHQQTGVFGCDAHAVQASVPAAGQVHQ
jgi:hypothetical protein